MSGAKYWIFPGIGFGLLFAGFLSCLFSSWVLAFLFIVYWLYLATAGIFYLFPFDVSVARISSGVTLGLILAFPMTWLTSAFARYFSIPGAPGMQCFLLGAWLQPTSLFLAGSVLFLVRRFFIPEVRIISIIESLAVTCFFLADAIFLWPPESGFRVISMIAYLESYIGIAR